MEPKAEAETTSAPEEPKLYTQKEWDRNQNESIFGGIVLGAIGMLALVGICEALSSNK